MSSGKKKMVLDWKGKFRFEAKTENGISVNFDAPTVNGGDGTAPTPMETVLASLAACTSFDVVSILKKKRQDITGYSIEATPEKSEEPPEVFTKIHLNYIIKGRNINKEAVERAIQLSRDKYCSVGTMLKKTAEITTSYEIIQQ
jgi:putative redox protein